MNHTDYVNLLRPAGLSGGGNWADLGAGSGAFTFALRELIGAKAQIHAVDKDAASLQALERGYKRRFPDGGALHLVRADFSDSPRLPPLDGVLMANSLHFFRDREGVLAKVRALMKPRATLLLVEYNADAGNMWVPFPLSYDTFERLAPRAGFRGARLLATHPSSMLREFYSAAAITEAHT
jgi:ubiquinone/menaquinone biosynthesis C-methylase UbiE